MNEESKNQEPGQSWNTFGLPSEIIEALHASGYYEPTQIQSLTLPAAILGRRDILGAAETGSGKTLAFALPIIKGILERKAKEKKGIKRFYGLVLTPTRELAIQVKKHIDRIGKVAGINTAVVIGGLAAIKQERILRKQPELVVATPGRLWELIRNGNEHLCEIDTIKYLAIDETDRMLEKGHFEELFELLELMNRDPTESQQRQNFVFSATLTMVHDLPKYLVNRNQFKSKKIEKYSATEKLNRIISLLGITNPKIVDLNKGSGASATLTESRITCTFEEKDYYVYYFLQRHPGRTLIFCNSISSVKRLANILSLLHCKPLPLHANMQQRQRLKNLDKFRDDDKAILVATDVAARGLDIPEIKHVLHYHTPTTAEIYLHRSGRTARASKEGITIILMETNEIKQYIKLCKTLGRTDDLPLFPIAGNLLPAVKQRVKLARRLHDMHSILKKNNSETGWFKKAISEMDIIADDFTKKYDDDEINKTKKTYEQLKKQLTDLLGRPLYPQGFSGKYPLYSEASMDLMNNKITNQSALETFKQSIKSKNMKNHRSRRPLYNAIKRLKGNPKKNTTT